MTLYLPIGPLKTRSKKIRYRDANPVPTSPLADDIAIAVMVTLMAGVSGGQCYKPLIK